MINRLIRVCIDQFDGFSIDAIEIDVHCSVALGYVLVARLSEADDNKYEQEFHLPLRALPLSLKCCAYLVCLSLPALIHSHAHAHGKLTRTVPSNLAATRP